MKRHLLNCDVLFGPTHHFGGWGVGNLASAAQKGKTAHPRLAVLQGLYKMKHLLDLGVKQILLPPQERPDLMELRRLGFVGKDEAILHEVAQKAPHLLSACSTSTSAFAANGATITSSRLSEDGRVHITPANLATSYHRTLETLITGYLLLEIFPHPETFVHHEPLPCHPLFADEGAANLLFLWSEKSTEELLLAVSGKGWPSSPSPHKMLPRQSKEAHTAIARLHHIPQERILYIQQNPLLIDQGIFHNDLIAMGYGDLLILHEEAFQGGPRIFDEIREGFSRLCRGELTLITIPSHQLSVEEARTSYLFNSQCLPLPNGKLALASPTTTQESPAARHLVEQLIASADNPIERVFYFDLSEAMAMGGGPACLRLPLFLSENELQAVHEGVFLNHTLYHELVDWANRNYRESLTVEELSDPLLLEESHTALDEVTQLLGLGAIYPFQQFP